MAIAPVSRDYCLSVCALDKVRGEMARYSIAGSQVTSCRRFLDGKMPIIRSGKNSLEFKAFIGCQPGGKFFLLQVMLVACAAGNYKYIK